MNRNMIRHLTPPSAGQRALRIALHAAAFASVILGAFSYQAVQAQTAVLPQGGNVASGQATINTRGNQMNVTNTPGAVINWNSFNIGTGAGVNFQQQNANSSVMNRVTGGNISTIHGNLTSNGRVILVNPAGLVVGTGAVVDTAGFVGSALNATEANAQLDRLRFDASGGAGRIQVDGMIRSPSGDIVLIAPDIGVGASALIQALNGAVTLAAGQRVQLHGKGLDGITLELQAPTNTAINLGRIEGEAVGLFAGQLRHSGIIDARQASIEGGRIVLRAADQLTVTGSITADGVTNAQGARGKGGNITLEGNRIALQGANISASGPAGGGTVNVGGGWQGKDSSIKNASQTFVDQQTQINANALTTGNGGQVVIWSDGDTWYAGKIEAKGGQTAGNGGTVEVSGKQRLGFHGVVNTTAANGQAGSLLLDPRNIYIVTGGTSTFSNTISFPTGGTDDFFISTGSLFSAAGTVTLQASNNIFVSDSFILGYSNGAQLTLEAGRSVYVNAGITSVNFGGTPSSVTIIANSSGAPGVDPINRDPGAGSIEFSGSGSIDMGAQGTVKLLVQNSPGNPQAGGITLTRVIAGNVIMAANTDIQMDSSASTLNGIDANNIVLLTQSGNIGSLANPVIIRPVSMLSTEVAVSAFALSDTVDSNAGNAFIKGQSTSGPSGGIFTVRIAPGLNPSDLASSPIGAQVNGELNVSNPGSIRVGANTGELGSADIYASNIMLKSGVASVNGQIIVEQNNGKDLNLVATQNIAMSVTTGLSANDSIAIGSAASNGSIGIVAGNNLTLDVQSINGQAGITVQGGAGSTNTTSLEGLNTTSLKASGDISVFSARVGGTTTSGVTILNSTLGDIAIEAPRVQSTGVIGGRVELVALGGDVFVAAGAGSSAVQAGLAGAQISTNSLEVYSTVASANQTSRIEAFGNGNGISLNATNIQIAGGNNVGAGAEISTFGGGSVNVISDNLTIQAGSGSGAGAAISSSGRVNATTTVRTSIDGSAALNSFTGISASTDVNLDLQELLIGTSFGPTVNSTYGISASGLVSVTAGFKISALGAGGASSSNSSALINGVGGVNLTMTNSDQSILIQGGDGVGTIARVQSSGVINVNSASFVNVIGGLGTGSVATINGLSAVNIVADNLNINAGTGNNVGASIESSGNVSATLANTVVIAAGGANFSSTGIKSQGNVNLSADTLQISAFAGMATNNSSYGVTATGMVNATITGGVTLYGATGALSQDSTGQIYGGAGVSINNSGGNILVTGGNGVRTDARIASGGDIALTSSVGDLIMQGGNGVNSNAIVTTTGIVTLDVADFSLTPGINSSHALIYAGSNSVTLAVTNPSKPLATVEQAGSTSPAIGAILVPNPDVSTTIALPSELPVGSTGTAIITFTNLSPITMSFTATVVVNGQTQTFPNVLLPASGTDVRNVTVTSTATGGSVNATTGSVTAVLGSTALPESNTANNIANAIVAPLFADITSTLALPAGAGVGTTATGTIVYTNVGAATTTFTAQESSNGVLTTRTATLAPGASQSYTVAVVVAPGSNAVTSTVSNSSVPESNTGNNVVSANIAPLFADISATLALPSGGIPGSSVVGTITYFNAGDATSTFTTTVFINGVPTAQTWTLAPTAGLVFTNSYVVGGAGNTITVNVGGSSVLESSLANNFASGNLTPFITDISSAVNMPPSTAPAGSVVPVNYTFTNNSSFTATFTPSVVINGVSSPLAPLTLNPGQSTSGTQSVMITGSVLNVSVVAGASSLPDSNPSNNVTNISVTPLLPDVQTSISSPASGTIGATTSAVITYVNSGAVGTQFTSTVFINGVGQDSLVTLGAGQSTMTAVLVPVGTSGAIVSASAVNIYDSNFEDNSASALIAGVAAPVVTPPVVVPPVVNPPTAGTPANVQPLIQNNTLQQTVIVAQLVPSGSSVNTDNSGDTNSRRPDSQEDVQADGAPICRP